MKKEIKKSQELISKITSGDIKQNPSWYFVFRNYIFWSVFFIFTIFGSIAFSIILYAMTDGDFDLLLFSGSKIEFLFSILPLLWIFFLAIFSVVSIFGIRHTKTGYRYSFLKILSINILLSVLLGSIFFYYRGAEKTERIFAENVAIYKSFEEHRISRWSNPQHGFLSGIILENKNNEIVVVKDFNNKQWNVYIQDVFIRSKFYLNKGEKIKIRGKILENNIFKAQEIRKWEGCRLQHRR